jgi:4-diphosphocytidyl-2-C-methyl-D-erythritol kinase
MVEIYSESAPAKVNLALHVTHRREDGYHDLESLVVFADICDELIATPAEVDNLTLTGPFAEGLVVNESNIVLRAVAAFRKQWPDVVSEKLAFKLVKNLPVAAGIGGGSADAAAALRLMASLSTQIISIAELVDLAAQLGADVPACLLSMPLVARGVGEVLAPLPDFPNLHMVLVNPMIPLATADVFRRLNDHENYPLPALPAPLTRPAQLGIWLAETRNDLQPPAVKLVPMIGDVIAQLGETQGCILSRMSGSGATVFGLYGTEGQAHTAAQAMRQANPDYWVAATALIAPNSVRG